MFRICCKLRIICPPFTVQIIIIQPGFLLPVNIINTAETMNIKNIAKANIFVEELGLDDSQWIKGDPYKTAKVYERIHPTETCEDVYIPKWPNNIINESTKYFIR